MNESGLTKKMVGVLRQRGAFAVKSHGDPRQRRGLPDIMFVYRRYGGGLEVKMPGKENTVTNIQAATLDSIRAAGGIALVVTEVAQVRRLLDHIDEVADGHRRRTG